MDHQRYQYHQIREIIFLRTIYLHLNVILRVACKFSQGSMYRYVRTGPRFSFLGPGPNGFGPWIHDCSIDLPTSFQCQLLTLWLSCRSSTIHRGSPSPHLAILNDFVNEYFKRTFEYQRLNRKTELRDQLLSEEFYDQ